MISADIMYRIGELLKREGYQLFYSELGEIKYREADEIQLMFRTHRRNKKRTIEIRRLVICSRHGTHLQKPGIQYFVPFAKRKAKNRYFQVYYSFDTIDQIAAQFRIEERQ